MSARIVHLSDLHFGALAEETVRPLLTTLGEIEPSLVVISGDLTQRARIRQFKEAREFIAQIPAPAVVVVPGNHDIPLWDVMRRFLAPRRRFERFICADPFPSYSDHDLAVVGVNTARSLTIKNGRINRGQLRHVESWLSKAPPEALRVVVAHHPFVIPEDEAQSGLVGRTEVALPVFLRVGVDLLLTGHRHLSWINFPQPGLLSVHAGTALSSRSRHESNAFNEIQIERERVTIRRFLWQPESDSFALPDSVHSCAYPRQDGRIDTRGIP